MKPLQLTIPSDYGCLAIVAYYSYISFVNEDWELEQLKSHILKQNNEMNIVPWGCVDGNWIVNIIFSETHENKEREFKSNIKSSGKLLLTTYDSITMAAQYEDEKLPLEGEESLAFDVPAGLYSVKIIQNFKTSEQDSEKVFNQTEPHFTVCLTKTNTQETPLSEIPWFAA